MAVKKSQEDVARPASATLPTAYSPLSSRGLGRRPLTAETGVRIPVAVLNEAPAGAGAFLVQRSSCASYPHGGRHPSQNGDSPGAQSAANTTSRVGYSPRWPP